MSAVVEYKDKQRAPGLAFSVAKAEPTNQSILEFESPSAAVITTLPLRPTRSTAWIVSALVISLVAVSALIPIDVTVTASGKIVSKAPTLLLQPLDQAIVRSIDVHEGQFVHAGDLLARLDPTFAAADMKSLEQQVASYQAQVDRDKAEAEGKPYVSARNDPPTQLQAALYGQNMADRNFKLEGYRHQINSLELQIARDLAQAAYYRQRLEVAGDLQGMRLKAQQLLVGSKLDTLIAIDNRLEMTRFMAQISATAESEKRDMQNLIAQRDAYDKEWYAAVLADMQTTQPQLDQAKENLKKARLHAKLVELRADQDAVVMSIAPVSVGSVMQPGQQFLTLVPADAPLEVEVDVLGSDAGFMRVGNSAIVKFDAFNYTLYGYAQGTVRTISPDSAYQPGAPISYTSPSMGSGQPVLTAPQGATPGATPYFVTRISLDAIKLHNLPPGFHVAPGMPTTVDVKVGTRTIVQYMFSRIAPIPLESMREP